MRFREIEKLIKADGWELDSVKGSHYHYLHSTKQGKVSIPHHKGDLNAAVIKSIKKQAQI